MQVKPFGLAVKALVDDGNGRVLLVRRSMRSKFFKGKWDPPGGKVDPGESFDAALVREAAEETNLTIALQGVAGAAEYEMPAVRVVLLSLHADVAAGDIQTLRQSL